MSTALAYQRYPLFQIILFPFETCLFIGEYVLIELPDNSQLPAYELEEPVSGKTT